MKTHPHSYEDDRRISTSVSSHQNLHSFSVTMAESSAVRFREWLQKLQTEREQHGIPSKHLPLTWRDLAVLGKVGFRHVVVFCI